MKAEDFVTNLQPDQHDVETEDRNHQEEWEAKAEARLEYDQEAIHELKLEQAQNKQEGSH